MQIIYVEEHNYNVNPKKVIKGFMEKEEYIRLYDEQTFLDFFKAGSYNGEIGEGRMIVSELVETLELYHFPTCNLVIEEKLDSTFILTVYWNNSYTKDIINCQNLKEVCLHLTLLMRDKPMSSLSSKGKEILASQ